MEAWFWSLTSAMFFHFTLNVDHVLIAESSYRKFRQIYDLFSTSRPVRLKPEKKMINDPWWYS